MRIHEAYLVPLHCLNNRLTYRQTPHRGVDRRTTFLLRKRRDGTTPAQKAHVRVSTHSSLYHTVHPSSLHQLVGPRDALAPVSARTQLQNMHKREQKSFLRKNSCLVIAWPPLKHLSIPHLAFPLATAAAGQRQI